MKKAYIDNQVVTVVEHRNISALYTPEICEKFIDCPKWVEEGDIYSDGEFIKTPKPEPELSIEERVAIQENENQQLKTQLEITQAVVDDLLFGGAL